MKTKKTNHRMVIERRGNGPYKNWIWYHLFDSGNRHNVGEGLRQEYSFEDCSRGVFKYMSSICEHSSNHECCNAEDEKDHKICHSGEPVAWPVEVKE